VAAGEVLVGVRADDAESPPVVAAFAERLPVRIVEARGVGVVGSMQSCLDASAGEHVALVDDDVELPPPWLETMLRHLDAFPDAVGVAGRDFLQDHPEMRRNEPRVEDVGRIHWSGRVTGNHHRGGGRARRVDILRGSNNLYRGEFLREVGFEAGLRGSGAQVHWEMALGLRALRSGRCLVYDPEIEVIHHVAPRHDGDGVHRGKLDAGPLRDIAFNETWVTLRYAAGWRRVSMLAWQFGIGSRACPGLVVGILELARGGTETRTRFSACVAGRWGAVRGSHALCFV
jgi:GT2 family glycosyltransferase